MLNDRQFPLLALGILIILFISTLPARQPAKGPIPKVIKLDPQGQGYQRLLGGPPETSTMRSGLVIIAPGKSVGKHNTDNYEELVIILQGQGEMRITGGETLRLAAGWAAYCPSHAEHDVLNTGTGPLQYVYVVAEVK